MEIRGILKMACIGGLYSMFVLALLEPFGIDEIKQYRLMFIICEGLMATVVAIVAVLLANLILPMGKLIDKSRWRIAMENLLIHLFNIPMLSAVLLSFCSWSKTESITAYWLDLEGNLSLHRYWTMFLSVTVTSVFIYIILLYIQFNYKLKLQLDDALAINDLLAARLDRQSEHEETATDATPSDLAEPEIVLESATEGTSLQVSPSDIVYAESMSNYADICYMRDGQLCHHQLRTTMRQLREQLADYPTLVSCHRAYIVNLNYVSSISMRDGSDYYQLQLFSQEKQIPVSRANTGEIKERLKAN